MTKRRLWLWMLVVLVFMGGCQQMTPRQSWMAAARSYNAAVVTLNSLYEANVLGQEAAEEAVVWAAVAGESLSDWKRALLSGEDPAAAQGRFDEALQKMQQVKTTTKGDRT